MSLLFMLIVAHCLADYSLQNDFIANAKNRNTALGKQFWHFVLPAHGIIHGGFVFMLTGSLTLGVVETFMHSFIDFLKCDGKLTFNQDQSLHLVCKLLYVLYLSSI